MTQPPSIVDAHVHFWQIGRLPYPWLAAEDVDYLRHDYLPGDLEADAFGLDLTAAVHVQAEVDHAIDPVAETAWLAELRAGHRLPTICVGYADLRAPDLGAVLDRHCEHAMFRGIRQEAWFDPASTRADIPRENMLGDSRWAAGLAELVSRDLSFDLLVWPHQLDQARRIFRALEAPRVVIDHCGMVPAAAEKRREWREALQRFATEVPTSAIKISAMGFISGTWKTETIAPIIHEQLEIFGADRTMLASNYPVERIAGPYGRLWRAYSDATFDLSAAERTAIFSGTASRFYRI